jgi:DNA adenine methylase
MNGLTGTAFAEPFGGGAGAALTLLLSEDAREIYINDADRAMYYLWWAMTRRPSEFAALIRRSPLNIREWKRQRDKYRTRTTSRLTRGFAAFYLNRTNRSGIIIDGGPIGGTAQAGTWKLNARFNRSELLGRCGRVAEFAERIHVSCDDGIEFIAAHDRDEIFLFIDPPYFNKGPLLYLNSLDEKYHSRLARQLRKVRHAAWVLTYDDCPEIRKLYSGWAAVRSFSLRYVAAQRRTGRELLITPKSLKLPTAQTSLAVKWSSAENLAPPCA